MNTILVSRGPLIVLKRMLGEESRAVRAYQDLLDNFKANRDEPEVFRDKALHFLGAVAEQLRDGVPYGYRPYGSPTTIFLGHGRSPLWLRVATFLKEDLGVEVHAFETEPRASQHIIDILSDLLSTSDLAVIVLTAEDLTKQGEQRARQNVVHEVGLFQGRLGFERVLLLEQTGVEEPSNLAGLQRIRFRERIEETFYELQQAISSMSRK